MARNNQQPRDPDSALSGARGTRLEMAEQGAFLDGYDDAGSSDMT
jgi:hypothetical protein